MDLNELRDSVLHIIETTKTSLAFAAPELQEFHWRRLTEGIKANFESYGEAHNSAKTP